MSSIYNIIGNMIAAYGFIMLLLIAVTIIANWKINEKAGEPGWSALIPFYSNYIRCKITWGNGWLFLIPIVCGLVTSVPVLGFIAIIVAICFTVMTLYKLSCSFGHDIGYTLGLMFFNTIFVLILGFGKDEYLGVPYSGKAFKKNDEAATVEATNIVKEAIQEEKLETDEQAK